MNTEQINTNSNLLNSNFLLTQPMSFSKASSSKRENTENKSVKNALSHKNMNGPLKYPCSLPNINHPVHLSNPYLSNTLSQLPLRANYTGSTPNSDETLLTISNSLSNEVLQTVDLILKDSFSAIRKFLHEFFTGETDNSSQPQTTNPSADSTSSTSLNPSSSTAENLKTNGEFLWKPKSDKNGNLAILLPSNISEDIKQVKILSPDKKKILATGKYSGIGNGDRAHFRFDKAGNKFPNNSKVQITLNNGDVFYVSVSKTNSRFSK